MGTFVFDGDKENAGPTVDGKAGADEQARSNRLFSISDILKEASQGW